MFNLLKILFVIIVIKELRLVTIHSIYYWNPQINALYIYHLRIILILQETEVTEVYSRLPAELGGAENQITRGKPILQIIYERLEMSKALLINTFKKLIYTEELY